VTPDVGEQELAAIERALSMGTLSTGEIVREFEREFASFVGIDHAAAVSSGTTALEFALEASVLEPGDGVIISPFNCSAVLYALVRTDLRPVFADICLDTMNLDPDAADRSIEASDVTVRGLLITHLFGQPCDMDGLSRVGQDNDLTLIDDFSQAPGATFGSALVGTFGQAGVCSFGATKNLTTAEGGMVVSDDPSIVEAVRTRRNNNGVNVTPPPRSARMSDIAAAMGRTQLERYRCMLARRREIAEVYRKSLPDTVSCQRLLPGTEHAYHRFPIRTSERGALREHLRSMSIQTRPVIETPLYQFECAPPASAEDFPNTERAVQEGLHLPVHSRLTQEDAAEVVSAVDGFFDD
jgi:dTDP-4-amino-4,6-dideoxygalactose transaminase